jgi:transposase InsO family protein
MVLKDHFSCLIYAVALPAKSPQHVARELRHILSYIGYPLIWHTDNGKEFGQQVVHLLLEFNPLCYTLTGCCRTPRDQGLVESSNNPIKRIIGNMVHEKQIMLETHPNLPAAQRKRLEEVSWV